MAAVTLTALPSVVYAGDSFLVELSNVSDYPAPTWTLTANFRGFGLSQIDFTSSANGSYHRFTVAAATTQIWIPGDYDGVIYATNGTDVVTVWAGKLTVKPDLAAAGENFDTRSHARKCLDAIKSVLEGKASRDAIATTIAGQSITRMSFDELLRAKSYYEQEVAQEERQAAASMGLTGGNQIRMRFGNS